MPSTRKVIKLLKETLNLNRIEEKIDLRMTIPHHIFKDIKCRKFIKDKVSLIPVSNEYDGDFSISFSRIIGRTRSI